MGGLVTPMSLTKKILKKNFKGVTPTSLNIFRKINNVRLGHQLPLKNVCLGPLTPLNIFRKIYNVRLGHPPPLKNVFLGPPIPLDIFRKIYNVRLGHPPP